MLAVGQESHSYFPAGKHNSVESQPAVILTLTHDLEEMVKVRATTGLARTGTTASNATK